MLSMLTSKRRTSPTRVLEISLQNERLDISKNWLSITGCLLPLFDSLSLSRSQVLLNAWQSLPIGGKAIEDSLFRLLSELSNSVDTFSDGKSGDILSILSQAYLSSLYLFPSLPDSLLKQQLEDIKGWYLYIKLSKQSVSYAEHVLLRLLVNYSPNTWRRISNKFSFYLPLLFIRLTST